MKILSYINDASDIAAVMSAAAAYGEGHELVVAVKTRALADQLPECNCKVLTDYHQSIDLQKRTTLWLEDWAEKRVFGGATIKEHLHCRDTSLWWFFLPVLAQDVLECIQYVEAFKAVFEFEKPDVFIIAGTGARPVLPFRLKRSADLPIRVAELVAREAACPIQSVSTGLASAVRWWGLYAWRGLQEAIHRRLGRELKWLARRGLALASSRGAAPRTDAGGQDKLLVLSCNEYWRETGEAVGGQRRVDDIYVAETLRIMREEQGWQIVDIDVAVTLPSLEQCRRLWKKLGRRGIDCRPFEAHMGLLKDRWAQAQMRRLRRLWGQLQASEPWRRSFDFDGVPMWPLLKGRLRYVCTDYGHTVLEYLAAVERMMREEAPRAVLLEYEEGCHGRAAMVAGRRLGIPTVGLQHGVQGGAYVPAYFFRAVNWQDGDPQTACPVPTRTAVFGQSTFDMLVGVSAYPAAAVTIIGSTMHDAIIRQAGRLDAATSRRGFGLDPARKTVAVLSSKFTYAQYHSWFVEGVLEAMKAMPDIQFIVKLHPRESREPWLEAAAESGVEPPLVVGDRLWESIAAADVVVSWYSTTVLDAMILEKPVVLLVKADTSLAPGYVGRNGIETVGDAPQLIRAIADRLERPTAYRDGLEQELYRLDGKASHRLAGLLAELGGGHVRLDAAADLLSSAAQSLTDQGCPDVPR